MKFSEYRRIRRQQEEEEQNTGVRNSTPVTVQDNNGNAHQRFTEIMKEREPQRYAYHQMQKEQNRIDNANQYIGKVNSFLQESNMSLASDAGYIKKHKDEYTPDSSEYANSRIEANDSYRQQAFDLMREAWSNNDLDDKSRQQVLDTLLNTAANHKKADDANKSFSDYMSQFKNQDAFERTREAERKQEEIANLSEDELQKKIQESEKALEEVKNKESTAYLESNVMNQGVGQIMQKMGLYNPQELDGQELSNQKNTLENDIKSYKNAIYQKRQQDTVDSLSEDTKKAFNDYYNFMTDGPSAEKKALSVAGLYDGYARQKDKEELKNKAVEELNKQGLNGEDFDLLYEYYQFSKDAERNEENKKKWEQDYEKANTIEKIGMNAGTVLTTPLRGLTAATESLIAPTYHDEYAPLNTNSVAYDLTNWTDTVRNKTSQDIDNGVANFLYQTGMNTADFLALLPINAATGNGASLAIMGTNAATSAAKEATQRGADKKQALLTGLTAGTAEVVFEKLSLDHFWDIARKQGKAATRSAFMNVLAQAGIEGSEEVFTDIANAFTDNLINGGLSDYYQNVDKYYKQGMSIEEAQKKASTDFAYNLGMSFAGGALSGGVIGAGASISTSIQGKKSDYETADYAEVAENMDIDRNSYETQEDYDKAMEVQSLAQDIASKGDKASDYEKGLYMQAAQQLPSVNYMDKETSEENVTDSVTSQDPAAEVKETLNNVLAGNLNISKQESTAEQIQRIASGLSNETVSKAFVADYKEGVPVDIYTTAFKNFFDAGYTDMPFDKALQSNDVIKEFVDSPTLQGIWFLGHNQAELVSKEYVSNEQKQLVDVTAKALGVKVEYQDIDGANGMYQNGTIYISNKAVQPAMVVLSHELTHNLKDNVPEEYSSYENYVIDYFKEYHAKEYEALYKSIENHYGSDEALIREEIAANASETFLTDADAVSSFVKENRTIAQRIADFLNNFVEKLRNLYKDYKAKGKAAKMLSEDMEVYQKARDLWYAAVKNNSENVTDSVTSNEKYSIKMNKYGVQYVNVDIDQDAFNKKTPEECAKIAKKTILDKFSGKIIGEKEGIPIVATKRTAKEYSYASKNYSKSNAKAKMKASPELDNLLQVSEFIKHSDDVGKHVEAVGGFDYYKTIFNVNGRTFEGIVNIMNTKNVRMLYDITKLRELSENEFPTENSSPASSTQPSTNNISQNHEVDNGKFSLKEPIEETKNLIALHNLTSDKLMKTLDLGGFPMPSIAITNTDIGHSNFGDISCVFYKDTIDPANKKNKVFGADAWTPTFPKVEYEADLNVARNVHDTISAYAEKLPDEYKNRAIGFVSGLEYSINNWGGYDGIIEEALRNTSMKAAYLVSKGEKVEEIEKTTVSELEPQKKKTCEMLLKTYGSKADKLNGHESGKELYEALGEETKEALIQNAVSRGDTEENARAFASKLSKFQIASSIRNALKYRENSGIETTTVVDIESMRKDIENRVDMNEYKEWLKKLFKGIEKNSGLWNGKEHYTKSGNARSFNQTHIPFNVQNIVEAMLKQSDDVRNVAGFNGTKTIRAVVTEDFKSISEIKKSAKAKLKNIDTDEYNALRDKLDERLNKVIRDIVNAKQVSDNVMIDMDSVGEIIIEACNNPTAENFKNTLSKYHRICTNEQAEEIADIVETVANMPVNMFEAKPLRVVDFSEVAAVVIPKGTSKELIQKITDNGMRIIEYEPGNESERKKVLNSIQNVKFSLKSYSDELGLRFSEKDDSGISENIERVTDTAADDSENSKVTKLLVQNTAKILQEGVNAVGDIKKANVSKDMCLTLASHYLQTYSASYDKNMLADNLYKIFAYIQKSSDNINYEDMVRVMQEVCKPVIETSQMIDQDSVQQYRDFCKTLKDNPIRLSNGQVAAVEEAYGSLERFKESTKGIYLFDDKNGTYLGDIWDKLVQESGSTLSYDTSSSDQMIELHRYVTSLKRNSIETSGELTTSQNAYDMALNIYTDYFKLIHNDKSIVKNLQDQMKNELKDYKDKANSYYKEKYQKILQDVRLKKDTQIRTLQKQLKQAEFESAAARSRLEGAQENLKTVSQKEYEKALQETMNAAGTIVDLTDEISKLKSRLESVQNRNAEKIAEMEAKNFDSYIGRHRAGKKTALKNHIKRNMTDLQNMLAKPKDNKYIPRELVLATIDLCETVNIDTGRSEKLAEKLNDLSLLYAKMKADPDYALSSEYDENTAAELRRLQAIFNGRNITALELEELEEVDELVNQLHHQITYAGKLIRKEKAEDVYKTAMKCMEEINSAKGYEFSFAKGSKLVDAAGREINKYNTSLLSPKRQFRRMSGYKDDSVLNQLYDELNEGQRKKMQVLMETARMFDEVTEGEHNQKAVRNLTGRKQEDWIDLGLNYKNQEPVMVPKAFRVSLAMHIQNKANLDHIIYGGLTIPEPKAYMRGDYKNAYAQGKTIRFIPDDADTAEKRKQAYEQAVRKLKSVTSDMTQYEKKMLSCAEKFFHEYTGEKINEVSLKLNGYKKARVQNYFPIRTDSNFNHAELEALVRNGTLEGMGMLTSRVGARNPILLEDITQVIQRQSENVAKYYGLAIPIRNFNKIYNTTAIGYQDSTKSTIARKWGADGQKYIENLLVDLQSHRGVEGSIFDTLQGNFSQAVLTNNISVASQQLAAYPTAAATLGHSAVMKGLKYIPTKLDMEHIAKYTPLLWYRNQGTGTQEIGDVNKRKNFTQRMLTDAAIKAEQTGIEPLAKAAEKVEAGGDYLLDVLQRIDTKAVGSLWKASEIYVQDNMGISIKDGEDFFYNEVAKVFNQCVDDTQANYSTMQRSDFQRNPDKILKTVFMFMTQPIQNYNIMYDAYGNLRAKAEAYKNYKGTDANVRKQNEEAYTKAKDEFANAISSQVVAATFIFGMKLLSNVLTHRMDKYRDDEDKISGVKIAESLADEIMANLIGSLVGGKELYDIAKSVIFKEKFYGFETGTVSMLSDFGQSLVKMTSDPSGENLWKVFMDGGSILGVPIENTYKIFRGLYLWGEDFANHEPFSFNAGHETPLATRYSNMLNALLDDDTNKYDKNYKKTKDSLILKKNDEEADKAIKSGIVNQLKKRYLSGDVTRGQAEEILKQIEQEDIYFVLKKWDNTDNDEYGKYSELQEAVINGKNIDEELKELTDHGVNEDTAMSNFWKFVKESYKNGRITKQRATAYLMQYKEDFDDNKVYWTLREWDKEDEYDKESDERYSQNDDLIKSVENGTFDTVVKEYLEHGYDASDIKTAISNVYRDKYKELYISGKSHEAYAIREKLNKLRVNGKRLYGQDDYLSWNKAAKKKE